METRFRLGQRVRSTVTAQGLRDGAEYEVVDVQTKWNFLGGFTTYSLWSAEELKSFDVGNGHLLLTEVRS